MVFNLILDLKASSFRYGDWGKYGFWGKLLGFRVWEFLTLMMLSCRTYDWVVKGLIGFLGFGSSSFILLMVDSYRKPLSEDWFMENRV